MADLFSDGFESGDLTAWGANDGGGDLTAHADAKLHGNYGAKLLIDDTAWKYVQDNTPASETRYRFRFYIDPNGLSMANPSSLEIIRGILEDWSKVSFLGYLSYDGVYKIQFKAGNDSAGTNDTSTYEISNAPHCIEVDWYKSSGSNDGFLSLWIDGVLKETVSSIDNDTFNVGIIRWGAGFFSGTISGTFYMDDFASNDDGSEIGELAEFEYTGTGSFAYSGTATQSYTFNYSYSASGSLTFSGTGTYSLGFTYTTSGSLVFSGTATQEHSKDYLISGSGSLAFSGTAVIIIGLAYTGQAGKWSGLNMGIFSTADNPEYPWELSPSFSGWVDELLAKGFTQLRIDIPYYDANALTISKSAVDIAVAKGVNVIWGVGHGWVGDIITTENWSDYITIVEAQALWAQNNGVYEFQIGNEEEAHNHWHCTAGTMVRVSNVVTVTTPYAHGFTEANQVTVRGVYVGSPNPQVSPSDMNGTFDITVIDTTHFSYVANGNDESNTTTAEISNITPATIRANIRTLATAVQAIFTNGNVSYSPCEWYVDDWETEGKGNLDLIGANIYRDMNWAFNDDWKTRIDSLINAFGADGTYITELNNSSVNLAHYSEDEAVQATGITEMIDYAKASGMKRVFYFCYYDDHRPFGVQGFGALKTDKETYRLLWDSLLGSGQFAFSGTATCVLGFSISGSGSLAFSGIATQEHSCYYLCTATGSLGFSSEATYSVGFAYTASGSFNFSGSATQVHSRYYLCTGSGNFTFSGEAVCYKELGYTATGSFAFSGTATQSHTYDYSCVTSGSFVYSGAGVYSIEFPYSEIDIGSPAVNRPGSLFPGYTDVNKDNPANASGKITSIEIYANKTMSNVEVATFHVVSGNNLSTRDTHFIGNVTAGSKQTFSGLNLNVQAGDYIGIHWTGGLLEGTATGYGGVWDLLGDHIPCVDTTFNLYATQTISLYGIGITISGTFTFSGAASHSLGFSYSGGGSFAFSGNAECSYEFGEEHFVYAGTGSFNYSGVATQTYTFNYAYSGTGTFIYSGSAVVLKFNFIFVGSGTLIYSGEASHLYCYSYTKIEKDVSIYIKIDKEISNYTKVDRC